MNSFEFWSHMQEFAQMSRLWWYTFAAMPAMIVAAGAYLLMAFALRHKAGPPMVFFWLLLASLPALLVFPSFYVSTNLEAALTQISFTIPQSSQDFSLDAAHHLGAALDTLALYGVIGASLAVVMMAAGSLVGDVPVASPLVQNISQSITKAMTRALNPRRGTGAMGGQYGTVRVTQGSATGSEFAVRNATIGKHEADIIITDSVVSRKHARLEVSGNAVKLWDEQSTNGTYIQRHGQEHELNGTAFELQPGDIIYLGPPHMNTAVAMVYERNGA